MSSSSSAALIGYHEMPSSAIAGGAWSPHTSSPALMLQQVHSRKPEPPVSPIPLFPSLLPSGTVSLQEDISQAQSPVREQQQAAARLQSQPQPTSSSLPACPEPVRPAPAACSDSPQKCSFSQMAAGKQAGPWGESLWHGTYRAMHIIGTGLCWLAPSPLSSRGGLVERNHCFSLLQLRGRSMVTLVQEPRSKAWWGRCSGLHRGKMQQGP